MTTSTTVLYDPYTVESQENPYPVYYNEKRDFWAPSRFEDVRSAARDSETFLSFEGMDIDDTAKDTSTPGFLSDIGNRDTTSCARSSSERSSQGDPALEDQVRTVVTPLWIVDEFAYRRLRDDPRFPRANLASGTGPPAPFNLSA
jgi:hypothetical protein